MLVYNLRRLVICKIFGYVLIFWEGRTLKKGQILAWKLRVFSLKFGLACRKIEASQGFWYQGARVDILFQNSPPLDLHNNRCPCYCPFSLIFPAVPPHKLGLSGKYYILESSLNGLSTTWISCNLKELENLIFLAHFLKSSTQQNNSYKQ